MKEECPNLSHRLKYGSKNKGDCAGRELVKSFGSIKTEESTECDFSGDDFEKCPTFEIIEAFRSAASDGGFM